MEQNRKRVTAPRIAAALSVLLAGAALYTVSGSERQGIQVKEYAEAAEAADSTITVSYTHLDVYKRQVHRRRTECPWRGKLPRLQ